MKTSFVVWVALLIASAVAGAESTSAGCCSAKRAAAEDATVAARSAVPPPLSARSLYQVESTWTNDRGEAVSLASLRGRPVVIALFFASCEYACPVLVSDMKRVRESLPPDARARAQFVLVTFDPVRDTPEALRSYRDRVGLDGSWTLLHGDAPSVQELAMLVGVNYKQDARGQFSHSNLITVLNGDGEIAFQRAGLMGDVSDAAKAVVAVAP